MKRRFQCYFNRWATTLMVLFLLSAAWVPSRGMAQTYSAPVTLYTFSGPDGQYPGGTLTPDGSGNFYGVTPGGGPSFSFLNGGNNGYGTLYKFSTLTGTLTTLASFDGLDGLEPVGSVFIDSQGNLWGVTDEGGVDYNPPINHYGWGTVWKYTSAGVLVPGLVEFSGPDGIFPLGRLALDSQGNLWGSTNQGGIGWNPTLGGFGSGTLFQLPPSLVRTTPVRFIAGAEPTDGPIFDSSGNIYGIWSQGGLTGQGALYELSATGVLTTLVSFTGPNGITPGSIVMDANGNIYGTTQQGGTFNYGTLWKYSPSGGFTTLVSFNGTNGQLGATLSVDSNGNVYGGSGNGGVNGGGILFKYSTAGVMSTLFDFNTTTNGAFPNSIVFDSQGNIWGTTHQGGNTGRGTIYTMQPVSTTLTVSSVTVSPTSLQGGNSASGTVTLSGPAPSGGLTVVLGSNSSFASPVGPIAVAPGATTASFSIVTEAVPQNTTVQISAILGSTSKQKSLTLTPPPTVTLVTIGLNPYQVQGGTPSTGTVTLNEVAPFGGTRVALSSDTPSAASVPSSVTVPAGATSANFNITTQTVSANTFVTITATLGSTSLQATLEVTDLPPITAPALNLDPMNVSGGSPTTGVVSLSRQAPPGGIVVALSSNSGLASVPANVTVPAGYIRTSFPVTTASVSTTTTATITASLNGSSVQTSFTITPASSVTLSSFTLSQPGISVPNGSASSVTGGFSSQGTVNLTGPAPTGGVVVTLSTNSGLASVPASVVITETNTTTSFAITTQAVTSNTNVVIAVAVGGVSQQATLTLTPPQPEITISSFTLNPTSVVGGNSSQGTVRLNTAAPSGGQAVTFTSSNAAASVTASIIIPAGSTSGTVTISTTQPATSPATAIISAGVTTGSVEASLTITGGGNSGGTLSSLTFNPASIPNGGTSTGTVTLSAPAGSGGSVVGLSADNPGVLNVPGSVAVPAGATTATFQATAKNLFVLSNTVVTVTATLGSSTQQASLTVTTGIAVTSISMSPSSVTGGNSSTGTVTIASAAPSSGNEVLISLSQNPPCTLPVTLPIPNPVTVPAGQTSVSFTVGSTSTTTSCTAPIFGQSGGATVFTNFTVKPGSSSPTVSSVTLNPTSVSGGNNSTGTVTLSSAAPSGGSTVSLSSSNTSVATVPSSVTVSSGQTSANFTVTTSSVTTNTNVTITATLGSSSKQAALTVTPASSPTVSSVTLNPTSVTGGSSSQGTVTLSGAAPSGGSVVSLSSNSGSASVPASVTVAAGATSASFTVTTTSVTTTTTAVITATLGSSSAQASLTITPAGSVTLSSLTLNPTSVSGGNNSTGTVPLSSAAPPGGATVTLTSSNTSVATVPSSVTVSAGQTSATFTVSTQRVSSNTNVTISGVYGATQSATLTVTGRRH
jgi:trimeric autotransporter adhesin